MIILSVHDGHDGGACLFQDGRIVLHSSEERRTNVPQRHETFSLADTVLNVLVPLVRSDAATRFARWLLPKIRRRKELLRVLADAGMADVPLKAYDHHLCHAACAYYHRPWEDDALVLTHDGAGDGLCATVSTGLGNNIRVISQTPKFHSLANFMYSGITQHLGLKPWEHEYKVMGMAPYGMAEFCAPILREMFSVRV